MCGIAGVFGLNRATERLEGTALRMLDSIRYRGPDSSGKASGEGWAIAHARLAIIDPKGGAQPIWNEDRSQVIVGNNEIYNAPELRKELEAAGHRFASRSDTEVILHGWEEWGEGVFSRLNGMFAVTLIDLANRQCVLARDPMGIKPLHFALDEGGIFFGSEIKAILPALARGAALDRDSMHLFMNLRYVPGNRTLFEGVERVPPGAILFFDREKGLRAKKFPGSSGDPTSIQKTKIPYRDAVEELARLLERSVERHLLSDVEIGGYLSGGVDSSVLTALTARLQSHLKAQKNAEFRTFCLGLGEPTDETEDAARVAELFQTRHETLMLNPEPLSEYRRVLWHAEEPKVNIVQGFRLAQAVSQHVKVAISGLGGDELFVGYAHYDILYPLSQIARWTGVSRRTRDLGALQSLAAGSGGDFFLRASEMALNARNPLQAYCILRNGFDHNPSLLGQIYQHPRDSWQGMTARALSPYFHPENPDVFDELVRLEARTKLVNDFLLAEDRMSMAHGLEVRVPFLDQELLRFAFSLPSSYKYLPGVKKRILKASASRWLPSDVLRKKKWGFSFDPVVQFQGPLAPFLRETLTRDRVEGLGVFSWKWISRILSARPAPSLRWHYFMLWMMAGFIHWHEIFIEKKGHSDGNP